MNPRAAATAVGSVSKAGRIGSSTLPIQPWPR